MIRILLITLLVATAPVRLFADDTGLYTGAVVVASQGAAERREALPRALAHVLRKLSGARDLEAVPGIEDALQGASALLVSVGPFLVDAAWAVRARWRTHSCSSLPPATSWRRPAPSSATLPSRTLSTRLPFSRRSSKRVPMSRATPTSVTTSMPRVALSEST